MTEALERIECIKARAERMSARELAVAFVTILECFAGSSVERDQLAELLVCRGLSARESLAYVDLREALTK